MNKNKTPEKQIRAIRDWEKDNIYKITVTFYKNDFPKEEFEKAKEEIRKMGISQNKFIRDKFKELLKKGDD